MSDEVKAVAPVMTAQAIEGEAGKPDGVPPPAPRVSDIGSDANDRGDIAAEMKGAAMTHVRSRGKLTVNCELDGVRQAAAKPAVPRVRSVRPPPTAAQRTAIESIVADGERILDALRAETAAQGTHDEAAAVLAARDKDELFSQYQPMTADPRTLLAEHLRML
jgi:hypothetical protein